ncbi:MAG: C_GCAxxG_C_C family protein [Clostridia bacterium]|nr:C_GCAxxG_C_C family protein [Clostridia bacterium]MBQ8743474.1 C_GCAxxG_C_C family protein [Clostridia bacterium]
MSKLLKTPEEYREIAKNNFTDGFNCAQAVCLAFASDIGLDRESALRLSSPFGGGMGRLREVCGAFSGSLFVLGAFYGYDDPNADEEKKELYRKVQQLAKDFKKVNGHLICRSLLELQSQGADSPDPEKRTEQYYKARPCAEIVAEAAYVTARFICEN